MDNNINNKANSPESQTEELSQQKMIISSSPHLLKHELTRNIMWLVSLCLLPAAIFGVYTFKFHAAEIIIYSIIFSVLTEALCLYLRKKPITITDGSAFLTGLLIGLNMPPSVPIYIPIISSIFAIAVVKQAFGGLGNNWANPAIAARIFALFAWTKHMTTWRVPFALDAITTATPLGAVKSALIDPSAIMGIDTTTSATSFFGFFKGIFSGPLELMNHTMDTDLSYFDLFFGNKGGCIGEISIFLLLIGALYLIIKKIITLDIPLSYILSVVLISWIFGGKQFGKGYFQGDFLFQLLTGGLILGAFFMATDMVTTPLTRKGRIIFGIGCGVITMLIRMVGGLPEGVSLSILFMNMLTPAIDRYVKIKPMGFIKKTNE